MSSSGLYKLFPRILVIFAVTYLASLAIMLSYGRWLAIMELDMLEGVASLVGYNVYRVTGNVLIVGRPGGNFVTIILTDECIGVYSMMAYALFVLAVSPIPLRERLRGLGIGEPILFLANLARILVALVAGIELGPAAFSAAHEAGGIAMIVVVSVLWVDWIYRTLKSYRGEGNEV